MKVLNVFNDEYVKRVEIRVLDLSKDSLDGYGYWSSSSIIENFNVSEKDGFIEITGDKKDTQFFYDYPLDRYEVEKNNLIQNLDPDYNNLTWETCSSLFGLIKSRNYFIVNKAGEKTKLAILKSSKKYAFKFPKNMVVFIGLEAIRLI